MPFNSVILWFVSCHLKRSTAA